jgi:hypothetical protein
MTSQQGGVETDSPHPPSKATGERQCRVAVRLACPNERQTIVRPRSLLGPLRFDSHPTSRPNFLQTSDVFKIKRIDSRSNGGILDAVMTWQRQKLSDLASISTGIAFRSRVEAEPDGAITVIQARDIADNGTISLESAAKVSRVPGSLGSFLQALDVLLQPRGAGLSVGLLRTTETQVVAAAPLLSIRCDHTKLLPEFLVHYLQMAGSQELLRSAATGTYIPQIPRTAIENLPLDLPDLQTQKKLVELAQMERREADLSARLHQMRGQLFELAVRQLSLKDRGRKTAAGPHSDSAGAGTPAES